MMRLCLLNYSWDFVFLSYEKTLCLIIHNSMCWFAMTDASVWDDIVHNNWEKRSWIEGEFLFLLCNKSLAQTRFIHFVSVTVFTAPWHKPSKGLYKRLKISLKSYQRCNSAFIYMFSMQSANGCAFICVFNSMGAKWNCMNPKLCVVCLPSSPSTPRSHFFSVF